MVQGEIMLSHSAIRCHLVQLYLSCKPPAVASSKYPSVSLPDIIVFVPCTFLLTRDVFAPSFRN